MSASATQGGHKEEEELTEDFRLGHISLKRIFRVPLLSQVQQCQSIEENSKYQQYELRTDLFLS